MVGGAVEVRHGSASLSGELTVVGQHQMDRVSAALKAGEAKAETADQKSDLLTPQALKPPTRVPPKPPAVSTASLAQALSAVTVTNPRSFRA